MGLEVGGVRGGILQEARGLDDVLEHAAHVAVDIGNIELAFLHALDDLFDLCGLSRLHEVVACMYLTDGWQALADADPVGHHDALVSPVVTQDFREQVVIAHGVLAVHLVVGCHDGPGIALADGDLKASEIELAGGTLGETLIDSRAVGLLRVDSEVLG